MSRPRLERRLSFWLTEFSARHARRSWRGGVCVALCAGLAWMLTFRFVRLVLWSGLSSILTVPWMQSLAALCVMGLLALFQKRANRQQRDELNCQSPIVSQALSRASWVSGDILFALIGPTQWPTVARAVAAVVMIAPRLSRFSDDLFHRAGTAETLDIQACSTVLAELLHADRKLRLEDLRSQFPDFSWDRIIVQITLIDGILVRCSDDPLLSISDERRTAILLDLESREAGVVAEKPGRAPVDPSKPVEM